MGLPRWFSGKELSSQSRKCSLTLVNFPRKIPWGRKWQPIPVFWPGKRHGQRSLDDYSPWGGKESNTTKHAHTL